MTRRKNTKKVEKRCEEKPDEVKSYLEKSTETPLISKRSKTCTILSCGNYFYDSYTSVCYCSQSIPPLDCPSTVQGPALTPLPAGPVSPKSAQVRMSSAVICLGRWWKCLDDGSVSL